jgi:Domain of unknown function (DUF4399)
MKNTMNILFASLLLVAVAPVVHAEEANQHGDNSQNGAMKMAKVYFVSPKDGATLGQEFVAKFAVEGLKVEKAGTIVPGTGHFHVLIDSPALPEGQVVPADDKHLHYGKGQTEATLKLTPGQHTLVLQFADGAHRAYNKMLTQEIKITVK